MEEERDPLVEAARSAETQPPTAVLIHGAGLAATSWGLVVDELRLVAPTMDAIAVELPGRGTDETPLSSVTLSQCVATVEEAVLGAPGPVVLVAHSLAAVLLRPLLGRVAGRVCHVVLVAPCLPPPGAAAIETAPRLVRRAARRYYERHESINLPGAVARLLMGNRMNRQQRDLLTSLLVPETTAVQITAPSAEADLLRVIPSTWVVTTRDRMFPPWQQRRFMRDSGVTAEVVEIDSGHMPLITHPRELAATIVGAARG